MLLNSEKLFMSNHHPIKPKNLLFTVDGAWRKQQATKTQISIIQKLGKKFNIKYKFAGLLTRGEASDLIHKLYLKK